MRCYGSYWSDIARTNKFITSTNSSYKCPTCPNIFKLCFLETEENAQRVIIERLVTYIAIVKANITQLETSTAGITRNIYCPTKYPRQQVARISDTVFK